MSDECSFHFVIIVMFDLGFLTWTLDDNGMLNKEFLIEMSHLWTLAVNQVTDDALGGVTTVYSEPQAVDMVPEQGTSMGDTCLGVKLIQNLYEVTMLLNREAFQILSNFLNIIYDI